MLIASLGGLLVATAAVLVAERRGSGRVSAFQSLVGGLGLADCVSPTPNFHGFDPRGVRTPEARFYPIVGLEGADPHDGTGVFDLEGTGR